MLKVLVFLWSGCWHKWSVAKAYRFFEREDDRIPLGTAYDLQCDRCGNIKRSRP